MLVRFFDSVNVLAERKFTLGMRRIVRRFGREPFDIVSNPFAFNHYGLRKGRYLKYCYSIVNELEEKFTPLEYLPLGKGV